MARELIHKCPQCGADLKGEGHTVSYAFAHGSDSWKFNHLRVGGMHFCNRECFEQFKAAYWRTTEPKDEKNIKTCFSKEGTCKYLAKENGVIKCTLLGICDQRYGCEHYEIEIEEST